MRGRHLPMPERFGFKLSNAWKWSSRTRPAFRTAWAERSQGEPDAMVWKQVEGLPSRAQKTPNL
jgi:hypothetical protein